MNPGLQSSLFGAQGSISVGPLAPERTDLGAGAWVDIQPGWLTGADELFEALAEGVPWQAEKRKMYDRVVAVPRLLSYYRENALLPHAALTAAREALSKHYLPELREPFRTAGLCYYRDGRDSVAWHGDRIGRGARQDTMIAILSVGAPRTLALRPRTSGAPAGGPGRGGSADPSRSAGRDSDGGAGRGGADSGGSAGRGGRADSGGGGRDSGSGRGSGSGAGSGKTLARPLGHGDLLVMGGSCQRTWDHSIPKTTKPVGPRISIQFRPRGVN